MKINEPKSKSPRLGSICLITFLFITFCSNNVRTTWRCSFRRYKIFFLKSNKRIFFSFYDIVGSIECTLNCVSCINCTVQIKGCLFFLTDTLLILCTDSLKLHRVLFLSGSGRNTFKQSGCVTPCSQWSARWKECECSDISMPQYKDWELS